MTHCIPDLPDTPPVALTAPESMVPRPRPTGPRQHRRGPPRAPARGGRRALGAARDRPAAQRPPGVRSRVEGAAGVTPSRTAAPEYMSTALCSWASHVPEDGKIPQRGVTTVPEDVMSALSSVPVVIDTRGRRRPGRVVATPTGYPHLLQGPAGRPVPAGTGRDQARGTSALTTKFAAEGSAPTGAPSRPPTSSPASKPPDRLVPARPDPRGPAAGVQRRARSPRRPPALGAPTAWPSRWLPTPTTTAPGDLAGRGHRLRRVRRRAPGRVLAPAARYSGSLHRPHP
jgi:hypothetical protein